ncbi:sigma-70 family RNA polymerase sigma factor [Nocardioides campestrisoli]|uniref:hypothetical protein n=1 Tax=Nocardioides campestrisoli TaxID=2736757 RepID=UPI00163DDA40|nr:hypothetical protein [Nocardioides campestrisoli]
MTRSIPTPGSAADLYGRVELVLPRAADADAKALVHLYDLTAGRVLGLVSRVVGPGEEAHELTVDVYAAVWEGDVEVPPGAGLPWLLHLAHSTAVAASRAAGPRRGGARAFPPDRSWLVGLAEDEREALSEVYLGGRGVEEADRRLGWSAGTAVRTVHRAMLHLAELHRDPALAAPSVPAARTASTGVAV